MSLYLKTDRNKSILFLKRGWVVEGEGYWRLANNNNPTPCQLVVENKVHIQKLNSLPNLGIVAQSYCHYAEQIKGAVKVMRVRKR